MKQSWIKNTILMLAVIIVMAGVFTACDKNNKNQNNNFEHTTPTMGATVTMIPTESEDITIKPSIIIPTLIVTEIPNNEISTTEIPNNEMTTTVKPEATKEVTIAPTKIPTPTISEAKISKKDAENTLRAIITDTAYEIILINENKLIEGKSYYLFHIKYKGATIEPAIIINKQDASMYYYNNVGNMIDFTGFPLDNVEKVDGDEKDFTKEDIISKLKQYSKEALGLKHNLSDYYIDIDEWTTIVFGKECYCIDVFEEVNGQFQLVGSYYITVDGHAVYHLSDDFILVQE